jgi:hypothetical protein
MSTTIGVNKDPISFIIGLLGASAGAANNNTPPPQDASNNNVLVLTMYPLQALAEKKWPSVVVYQATPTQRPLNVGSTRYRHWIDFNLNCLALTVQDRFNVEYTTKNRLYQVVKVAAGNPTSLATNYVYMYIKSQSNQDDVKSFGTNIYRSVLTLELVYDIVP